MSKPYRVLFIIDDLGYDIKKSNILKFKGTKRRIIFLVNIKILFLADDCIIPLK